MCLTLEFYRSLLNKVRNVVNVSINKNQRRWSCDADPMKTVSRPTAGAFHASDVPRREQQSCYGSKYLSELLFGETSPSDLMVSVCTSAHISEMLLHETQRIVCIYFPDELQVLIKHFPFLVRRRLCCGCEEGEGLCSRWPDVVTLLQAPVSLSDPETCNSHCHMNLCPPELQFLS